MSEHRPFNKAIAREVRRRFEWVALEAGDLCVREMTVKETVTLTERAARPSIDPRGARSGRNHLLADRPFLL